MKAHIASVLFLIFLPLYFMAQDSNRHKVYLIPGQAADYRSFQFLELDDKYEIEIIEHPLPERNESMVSLARRLSASIDTTRSYSFVGVSLGGMLAIEMSKYLQPEKIIIIASIKGQQEMPKRYKFLRVVPLYKLFNGGFYQWGANFLRPLFEHDSDQVDEISRAMLEAKPRNYIKRTIHCIITWRNETIPENLVHIHGDKDNTLPHKNIGEAITIKNGTHMMVMTSAKEVSQIINQTLAEVQLSAPSVQREE
ncbi:MAG: alpha/beta hydrolase [Bacteroidota bacterium]